MFNAGIEFATKQSLSFSVISKLLQSGLLLDGCSKCTMGSTGKTFNYLKDCLGLCDKAINDSCGNCLLKSASKNFIDCNGVCNGKAFNNSCGHCVNGTTGKPNNLGKILSE